MESPEEARTFTKKQVIPLAEIRRDLSSYVDPHGFVFHFEDQIYRHIHPGSAALYEQLLSNGVGQELEQHGMVATHLAALELEDTPGLVLQHEKIKPLTYCVEWCPSMLRDAGLMTLDLALVATRHDLMLQDAYPWNVVFDGPNPVMVDYTSVVPVDQKLIWPAHEQFEAFFLRPLMLAGAGRAEAARGMLYNNITGIGLDSYYRLTSGSRRMRLWFVRWLDRRLQRSAFLRGKVEQMADQMASRITPQVRTRFLERLVRRLKAFTFVTKGDPWSHYYREIDEGFDKQVKLDTVQGMLEKISPDTVLDLGCNTGVFSLVAARTGARVTSVDSSEPCLELLYAAAKDEKLRITPTYSDVLCPTPAFGFQGQQYPALWQRVASDVVLCLGLMHHLHLTGRQSFERIAELVASVSKRCLIFEFVARDDANNRRLPERRETDYTLDTVVTALKGHFAEVEVHPSDRDTRRLLVCKKR